MAVPDAGQCRGLRGRVQRRSVAARSVSPASADIGTSTSAPRCCRSTGRRESWMPATSPATRPTDRGNSAATTAAVTAILERGAVPVCIGGDDSVPIPILRAYAGRGPLTVLQVDAHLDFRDEVHGVREGYSSPMRRASEMDHVTRIVQVGLRGRRLGAALRRRRRARRRQPPHHRPRGPRAWRRLGARPAARRRIGLPLVRLRRAGSVGVPRGLRPCAGRHRLSGGVRAPGRDRLRGWRARPSPSTCPRSTSRASRRWWRFGCSSR